MKRILMCGLALMVCWLGVGTVEAAAIKSDVNMDLATPLVQLADSSEAPITLARHGYRYGGQGCYYGPPRRYRSYYGGYGYGHHRQFQPRRRAYYGRPYGHGYHPHHHGGFGLYIGF